MTNATVETRSRLGVVAIVVLFAGVEIAAGVLAFHTIGEIVSLCSLALVGLNLPIFALAWSKPGSAAVGAFLLLLVLVPHQAVFGLRWLHVRAEAERLVDQAYEARFDRGEFPASLDFYRPRAQSAMRFIRYKPGDTGDAFEVSYWVGTRSTSHWYDSDSGWHYYPD